MKNYDDFNQSVYQSAKELESIYAAFGLTNAVRDGLENSSFVGDEKEAFLNMVLRIAGYSGWKDLSEYILIQYPDLPLCDRVLFDTAQQENEQENTTDMLEFFLTDKRWSDRFSEIMKKSQILEILANFDLRSHVEFVLTKLPESLTPPVSGPKNNQWPIVSALARSRIEIADYLLKSPDLKERASLKDCVDEAFLYGADEQTGSIKTIEYLLKEGYRPNPFDQKIARSLIYTYFDDVALNNSFFALIPYMDKDTVYQETAKYPAAHDLAFKHMPEDRDIILKHTPPDIDQSLAPHLATAMSKIFLKENVTAPSHAPKNPRML